CFSWGTSSFPSCSDDAPTVKWQNRQSIDDQCIDLAKRFRCLGVYRIAREKARHGFGRVGRTARQQPAFEVRQIAFFVDKRLPYLAARLGAHRRPPARGGLAFPRAPFLRSLLVAWQAVRVALDGRCIPFLQRVAGCLDDLTV